MKIQGKIQGKGRLDRLHFRVRGVRLSFVVSALLLLSTAIAPVAVRAASTLISQGFLADNNITVGSIVSLKKDSTDTVEATTTQTSNNIMGVVINTGNSQVSV